MIETLYFQGCKKLLLELLLILRADKKKSLIASGSFAVPLVLWHVCEELLSVWKSWNFSRTSCVTVKTSTQQSCDLAAFCSRRPNMLI